MAGLLIGLWLFSSPFRRSLSGFGLFAWDDYAFGVLIVALSALALSRPWAREVKINLLVGLWLIVAPFVLGFASHRQASLSDIGAGVAIVADLL
jgi:hypothetical protein